MRTALNAGIDCYCTVDEKTQTPLAVMLRPAYYFGLVPLPFLLAVGIISRPVARAMSAVLLILAVTLIIPGPLTMQLYGAGFHIPGLLGLFAIPWPQVVLFGPNLYTFGPNGGSVLPWEWSHVAMVPFWLATAAMFGILMRRVRSFPKLLALSFGMIIAIALTVHLIVPLFGWEATLEGP